MTQIAFITRFRSLATRNSGYLLAGTGAPGRDACRRWPGADPGRGLRVGPTSATGRRKPARSSWGISESAQAEMEAYAAARTGGPEALAALRIAALQAGSASEDEIVRVQDPFTAAEILVLRGDR